MTKEEQTTPSAELARIVESAHRLGIELNESEALQWMTAIASFESSMEITVDADSGVFGNKIVMLDFSPLELAHFREIGKLVEFFDQPGIVETALALSGSSAQSKIQTYPGDCDYFERINIKAATREQACQILSGLMRDKALSTIKGATYQLLEVKFEKGRQFHGCQWRSKTERLRQGSQMVLQPPSGGRRWQSILAGANWIGS
jgi:hypothetical protein